MIPIQTDDIAEYRVAPAGDDRPDDEAVRLSRRGRRPFLRTISAVGTVGVTAGCLGDIGGNSDDGDYSDSFDEDGNPEYGNWFDDVDNYDGTVDARDETEVTVAVGANGDLTFDPPAVLIKLGSTVRWKWTGDGGQYDVAHVGETFESELTREADHVFEHAFDESGIYRYVCNPHQRGGMKGAIAVSEGEDSANKSNHGDSR